MKKHHQHRHQSFNEVVDPVCKMKISPKTAIDISSYQNENYYFCSEVCRIKFDLEPATFIKENTL